VVGLILAAQELWNTFEELAVAEMLDEALLGVKFVVFFFGTDEMLERWPRLHKCYLGLERN